MSIKAGRGKRNAYYHLINGEIKFEFSASLSIYNSNNQRWFLLARTNAITVGKGRGRSENDSLTDWKYDLQVNLKVWVNKDRLLAASFPENNNNYGE